MAKNGTDVTVYYEWPKGGWFWLNSECRVNLEDHIICYVYLAPDNAAEQSLIWGQIPTCYEPTKQGQE